jgi:superfamily II DNA/RNA helicase
MSFVKPTPIQERSIPIAVTGRDLIGVAQTGTGKTAAFCIPILTQLLLHPAKTALILAPTRELALQIDAFWKTLTQFTPHSASVCLIGGAPMGKQLASLRRNPRVIIATPGRLIDHLQQRSVNLTPTGILVLDEADRMLDMGFAPQLAQILKYLPPKRQTLLFTATWEAGTDQLAKKYLHNPERVSVGETSRAASTITQALVATTVANKNDVLLDELNRREGTALIFTRTKSRCDRVWKYLESYGVEASRIHGDRSQGQRNLALAKFKDGRSRVLVATDIAARGIDVTEIQNVINYDLPQLPEDYIHRIGRTGRAGATGTAISLITPEDRAQWQDITRLLKRTGSPIPAAPAALTAPNAQRPERKPKPPGSEEPASGGGGRRHFRPRRGPRR